MDKEEVRIAFKRHLLRYSPNLTGDISQRISKEKVVEEQLGSDTMLYTIPERDFELLTIGGNKKYERLGASFNISLSGSVPLELAVERVQERVRKISPHLFIEKRSDGYEDVFLLTVRKNLDQKDSTKEAETYIQEGSYAYLILEPEVLEEGKSYLNLNKDHYILQHSISIDKDLYEDYKEFLDPQHTERNCKNCGVLMFTGSDEYCPVCNQRLYNCPACGNKTPYEKLVRDDRGRWICKKCAEKPRCRGCQGSLGDGEEVLCSSCSNAHSIYGYHSGIGRSDESEDYRYKVGIEVEKEDEAFRDSIDNAELLRATGWVAEQDSSLDEYEGFEIISPIYPLDIPKLEEKLSHPLLEEYLAVNTSDRCGGHIHISDIERTPHEILRDIRGYLPLLYSLYPKRATNSYCEAKEVIDYLDTGHRQALNLTDRTLEFRIFPAVKDKEQLMFRLTLIKYMIDNPEKDPIKVGEKLLDTESPLYKILNQKISATRLKEKAEAFIDFTNYLERDSLIVEGKNVKRTIRIPKVKQEKDKEFYNDIANISEDIKRHRARLNTPPTPPTEEELLGGYGWICKLSSKKS